jgi:hypothetical protein
MGCHCDDHLRSCTHPTVARVTTPIQHNDCDKSMKLVNSVSTVFGIAMATFAAVPVLAHPPELEDRLRACRLCRLRTGAPSLFECQALNDVCRESTADHNASDAPVELR